MATPLHLFIFCSTRLAYCDYKKCCDAKLSVISYLFCFRCNSSVRIVIVKASEELYRILKNYHCNSDLSFIFWQALPDFYFFVSHFCLNLLNFLSGGKKIHHIYICALCCLRSQAFFLLFPPPLSRDTV